MSRARDAVALAAKQVQDPLTRTWLTDDREGTFRRMAEELLDQHETVHLAATNEEILEGVAIVIAIRALKATERFLQKP